MFVDGRAAPPDPQHGRLHSCRWRHECRRGSKGEAYRPMESALNRAHQLERKADFHLRNLKFDEAIECHQRTAELLTDAMQLTTAARALESLQLQHDYHIRRQAVIRYKQVLLKKVHAMNKQMVKIAMSECSDRVGPPNLRVNDIQDAIYRNIEENDSLLKGLITGNLPLDNVMLTASKTPKDDKMIIEELQINNDALRRLVDGLITQLEESHLENKQLRSEVEQLKSQVQQYEKERRKLKVITDSCSPYVLSPSSELSPVRLDSLPVLAPLEMPNFDFIKFVSASESSTANHETQSS